MSGFLISINKIPEITLSAMNIYRHRVDTVYLCIVVYLLSIVFGNPVKGPYDHC